VVQHLNYTTWSMIQRAFPLSGNHEMMDGSRRSDAYTITCSRCYF
jgi:hypothetical protein